MYLRSTPLRHLPFAAGALPLVCRYVPATFDRSLTCAEALS